MQCASSTTSSATPCAASAARNSGSARRSGVANTMSERDSAMRSIEASCALAFCALLSCSATTPASCSLPAWSFISEISGDTTTVVPSRCSAGNW